MQPVGCLASPFTYIPRTSADLVFAPLKLYSMLNPSSVYILLLLSTNLDILNGWTWLGLDCGLPGISHHRWSCWASCIFMSIILSRQMHRHPTLLNFCATWTIASVVYTLLYDKLHNGSLTTLLMDSLEVYSPGRKERTIHRSVYVSLKQPW